MFIYWAIFVVLAVGALLNQDQNQGRGKFLFFLLASMPTALMIGLRWQIGPDWGAYLDIFQYSHFFSIARALKHQDPGFMVLNVLLTQSHEPFWALNLICGIVFVAGLTAFCRRQPNPWLAFLVAFPYLVIVVGMSGDRQSVALGFLFFALNAFEREKLNQFVLLIVIAALFHGSVLLILPICLLSYTRNGLQQTVLLIIAAALGYYFFRGAFDIYAQRYSAEKIQSTGVVYRLAMNGFAAVFFLAFEKRFVIDDHQKKLWHNVSLATLGLGLLVLVVPSSTAVDRFLLYLFPLQFFVLSRLPKILSPGRQASSQLTFLIIGYAALVQLVFLQLGTYSSYYIPYRSILSGTA